MSAVRRRLRLASLLPLFAGLMLVACGGDDGNGGGNAEAPPAEPTVRVGRTAAGADMLVAANGRTLYVFEQDRGTTTACTGACASKWPALVAARPTAGKGVDATKLTKARGQVPDHVVYAGHLLYFFAGDTAPGDMNGASVPGWHPVTPAGEALATADTTPTTAATTTTAGVEGTTASTARPARTTTTAGAPAGETTSTTARPAETTTTTAAPTTTTTSAPATTTTTVYGY